MCSWTISQISTTAGHSQNAANGHDGGENTITKFKLFAKLRFLSALVLSSALVPASAHAFSSGIERLGIDPRSIDEGFSVRCYQDDALEAGRPYKSYETEFDAALQQTSIASGLVTTRFNEVNAAKDAAKTTFEATIAINNGNLAEAKAEAQLISAFRATAQVVLKIEEYQLVRAQLNLAKYNHLKSGQGIGEAAALGAINGAQAAVLTAANPAPGSQAVAAGQVVAVTALATLGAAAQLAKFEGQGGRPYLEAQVAEKSAAVAATKATIVSLDAQLEAAILKLLNSFGVVYSGEPTPVELQAVQDAETAFEQANAAFVVTYDKAVAIDALEIANAPPPCDSLEITILLEQYCTAPDEPLLGPNATAFDRSIVAEICKFASSSVQRIQKQTHEAIGSLVSNRQSVILNNQVNISGFLAGSRLGGIGPLGSQFNLLNHQGSMSLAFSSSLSSLRAKAIQREKQTRLKAAQTDQHSITPAPIGEISAPLKGLGVADANIPELTASELGYDIWTQIYGSQSKIGDSESTAWVGFLGAHYFISPDLIVGGLVQVDWSDETNSVLGSSADGLGWMVGPYVAAKLPGQKIFIDAQASWGRSNNHVAPIGTYEDKFMTERWLVSSQLSGLIESNGWEVRPAVKISYFEEVQKAYIDSNGLDIPDQSFSVGEMRFGATISHKISFRNGFVLTPHIGVNGVRNFGVNSGAVSQNAVLGSGDMRARLDAGFTAYNLGLWSFNLSGFFDGLGIDDYQVYGGTARLSVALQ